MARHKAVSTPTTPRGGADPVRVNLDFELVQQLLDREDTVLGMIRRRIEHGLPPSPEEIYVGLRRHPPISTPAPSDTRASGVQQPEPDARPVRSRALTLGRVQKLLIRWAMFLFFTADLIYIVSAYLSDRFRVV